MSDSKQIILASGSPRRQEMLRRYPWNLKISPPDVDETQKTSEKPAKYCKRLATSKAEAVWLKLDKNDRERSTVIAADTIVVLKNKVFGKPTSPADSVAMLKKLSGNRHTVLTAVSIISKKKTKNLLVKTKVRFRKLSSKEIAFYVASGEPADKAGSYAAQGLGMGLIADISGSYTNVVGLPLAQLIEILERDFKFRIE